MEHSECGLFHSVGPYDRHAATERPAICNLGKILTTTNVTRPQENALCRRRYEGVWRVAMLLDGAPNRRILAQPLAQPSNKKINGKAADFGNLNAQV